MEDYSVVAKEVQENQCSEIRAAASDVVVGVVDLKEEVVVEDEDDSFKFIIDTINIHSNY